MNVRYTMRDSEVLKISFDLTPELELAKDNANLPEILKRFDLLLCHELVKAKQASSMPSFPSTAANGNICDWKKLCSPFYFHPTVRSKSNLWQPTRLLMFIRFHFSAGRIRKT